jgi:hypothetical protein
MLTYYNSLAVAWHKILCKVQHYLNPSKTYTKTVAPVKFSKPLSTADRMKKSEVPILVPHYEPSLHRSDYQVDSIRSYLHILKNSINANINSVTSDDVPIILDSGCSITVTNDPSDFIPRSLRKSQFTEVKGISSVLKIEGIGVMSWKLKDINSHIVNLQVQAIYVPACPFCLLPPQQLSQAPEMSRHNSAWIGGGSAAKVFYQGHCLEFAFELTSQLPIAKTEPGSNKFAAFTMNRHGCSSKTVVPRLLNTTLNSVGPLKANSGLIQLPRLC